LNQLFRILSQDKLHFVRKENSFTFADNNLVCGITSISRQEENQITP